jgi:hypothetical protein
MCFLILGAAAVAAGGNLWMHRSGYMPGFVPRSRYPRIFGMIMTINWLIFAIFLFAFFDCLFTSMR